MNLQVDRREQRRVCRTCADFRLRDRESAGRAGRRRHLFGDSGTPTIAARPTRTQRPDPPPARAAGPRPDRAARMERAAGRQFARASAAGPESDPAAHRRYRRAGCSAAARRCRDGADARRSPSTGPVSTIRPPYITATRWATSATTPRSWVIRITAAPVSAWRRAKQRQHLRLHGDVERGRRLVGDDQLGVARHRHGDHGALAHAARELVRDIAGRARRDRRCRPRAGARRPARAPLRSGVAMRDLALCRPADRPAAPD